MHALIDYKAKRALSGLQFKFFNNDKTVKINVKEITIAQSIDHLLNPVTNGPYDLSWVLSTRTTFAGPAAATAPHAPATSSTSISCYQS